MQVYSPTRALLAGKLPLSLLLAALGAALLATLISAGPMPPQARSPGAHVLAAKQDTSAPTASPGTTSPGQATGVQQRDARPAIVLYILHGLGGQPLRVFK